MADAMGELGYSVEPATPNQMYLLMHLNEPAASPSPTPAKQQEPSGFKLAGFFRKNGKLFERLKGRPNEHTLSSGWNAHYIATSERDQIADWDVRESVETSAPGASTEDKQ